MATHAAAEAAGLPRPLLALRGIEKRFGAVAALSPIDLAVGAGEFFALLGPSGCGKTTLLRIIAGLETPDSGSLLLDGQDITALPAYRRPLNLVFQSYALFPHMDVAANVAFGLRQEGVPRAECARRVDEALALVRMSPFERRKPHQLSGGQQQRVALARALIKRPAVLLLDEPMAALDRSLREEMQGELKRIQRGLGTTFIIVTHDQDEAMRLADRIAVMREGRIVQCASPAELYAAPADQEIARFFGEANLLPIRVVSTKGGRALCQFADGSRLCISTQKSWECDDAAYAVIRPEQIALVPNTDTAPGETKRQALITATHFLGDIIALDIEVQGWGPLKASVVNRAGALESHRSGRTVFVAFDEDGIALVPRTEALP